MYFVCNTSQLDCEYYSEYPELQEWHTNVHQYVGGDYENACSTPAGMRKYEAAKLFGSVVDDGCQMIPPINCGGKYEATLFNYIDSLPIVLRPQPLSSFCSRRFYRVF